MLAEAMAPQSGAAPASDQLDTLSRNLDNLRTALRFWIAARTHEAVRLAAALRHFWYGRGHLAEGRAWLAQALAVDAIPRRSARGYALLSAGQLAHNQEDHAAARPALDAALAIFADLENAHGRAAVLNELAWLHFDAHEPVAAIDCFEESIALVRTLADPGWLGVLLSSTAMVLGYQDRHDPRMRAYFAAAIDLHRAANDPNGRAHALLQLAVVDGLEGRYAEARQLAEEALTVVAALNRPATWPGPMKWPGRRAGSAAMRTLPTTPTGMPESSSKNWVSRKVSCSPNTILARLRGRPASSLQPRNTIVPACAWLCNKMMCAWSGAALLGWAWWRLWQATLCRRRHCWPRPGSVSVACRPSWPPATQPIMKPYARQLRRPCQQERWPQRWLPVRRWRRRTWQVQPNNAPIAEVG